MSTDTAKPTEKQEQWVLIRTHRNSPMLTLSLPGVDLDNVLLVRIEPGISSALHTDCRLAMDDPANVYKVSAYPGVVNALKRAAERIISEINHRYGYSHSPGHEGAFANDDTLNQIHAALSLVHPAEGGKT